MLRLSKSQMCHSRSLFYLMSRHTVCLDLFYGCRAKRLLFNSTLTNDEWDVVLCKNKSAKLKIKN